MKKLFLKIWPVLFIVSLWMLFSTPYFFGNKVPFSSTYQLTFFPPWSAYPHNGVPVKNAAMPDVISQILPWKHLVIMLWKSGQIPLWNIYSFGGTPLLANYQSAALSPFNLLFFILPFTDGWSMLVLLQPLLAGLFAYVFARSGGVSRIGSLVSSLSFMFCGFLVSWMGYGTLGYALLFLPLGMYAIEKYVQTVKARYILLLSVVLPLSFFSGHFQISLYVLCTLFAFCLYKGISAKSLKIIAVLLLSLFFGMLVTLPQLLPSLEFYSQSLRSGLYQRSEVIAWSYLPTLLAPDFFGNAVTRNDWFGHYAEWNGFIGTITLILAWYGVKAWKKSVVPFLLVGGVVALLFALPTPLGDLLVWLHIPVLATSAASRVICIYCFLFATLAGFGWDSLIEDIEEKKWKSLLGIFGIFGMLFIFLWMVVLRHIGLPVDKALIARQNLLFPTILFIGVISSVTISFLIPKKYRITFLAIAFIAFVSFDMYRFATKWQSFDPKSYVFAPVAVTKEFQKISSYQRTVGNYGAEVADYYRLPYLEGYDALYPLRYGQFISSLGNGKVSDPGRSVVSLPRLGKDTPQAINLLNTVYIIHKKSDDNMLWTLPYWQYPKDQFSQIYEDDAYRVLKNTAALPRAFLVGKYVVEKDSQKIIDSMFGKNFDLRREVVLEQNLADTIQPDPQAKATISSYVANKIVIQISSRDNQLLFLSDPFYPGWNAYVDGKKTAILRADFAFRAVEVPKGKHTVIFSYQPMSFYLGIVGLLVGLFGILGAGMILSSKHYFQN